MAGAITISASYGAAGATIGQLVAARLGLPFFDRAIPLSVARNLELDSDEALARDERPPSKLDRLLNALASASAPIGPEVQLGFADNRTSFCRATEVVLREIADGTGGVILGRAGMVVLGDRPDVLRVRLDGPLEDRIAQGMRLTGVDEQTARTEQRDADHTRELYAQVFYGVSQGQTGLYDVILDSTALSIDTCVDVVITAAYDRLGIRPKAGNDR